MAETLITQMGNWDAKLTFAINFPSRYIGGLGTTNTPKIVPIESFSTTENITQTTTDSINAPHIGFVTALGEFTGSFKVYETGTILATMDEIIKKNLFFDISIASTGEGDGTAWKVEKTLLKGCKITRRDRAYEYGKIPLRTYSFKYLQVEDIEESELGWKTIDFGEGDYNVGIDTGKATQTDQRSSSSLETITKKTTT